MTVRVTGKNCRQIAFNYLISDQNPTQVSQNFERASHDKDELSYQLIEDTWIADIREKISHLDSFWGHEVIKMAQ